MSGCSRMPSIVVMAKAGLLHDGMHGTQLILVGACRIA
jgi:hypothetical protein